MRAAALLSIVAGCGDSLPFDVPENVPMPESASFPVGASLESASARQRRHPSRQPPDRLAARQPGQLRGIDLPWFPSHLAGGKMRAFAKRRWKRKHKAAQSLAQDGDLEGALSLHLAALRDAESLRSSDKRRVSSLSSVAEVQRELGRPHDALATIEHLLEAHKERQEANKPAAGCTLLEAAELHLEIGDIESAAQRLEASLNIFRDGVHSFESHRERTRRFRESGSWSSLAGLREGLAASIAGARHLASAAKYLKYPEALELLTQIKLETGAPAEAVALQRELIDLRVAYPILGSVVQDLEFVLQLQQEHGLYDQDSPRLASAYLELAEEAEDVESADLLTPLSFVYETNCHCGSLEVALDAAERGTRIATDAFGKSAAETTRWVLAKGDASCGVGDFEVARKLSLQALESIEPGSERERELRNWALELQASSELRLSADDDGRASKPPGGYRTPVSALAENDVEPPRRQDGER